MRVSQNRLTLLLSFCVFGLILAELLAVELRVVTVKC